MLASTNWHLQLQTLALLFKQDFYIIFFLLLATSFFAWICPNKVRHLLRINPQKRQAKKVIRDAANTLCSVFIFALATQVAYIFIYSHHHSLLYTPLLEHGWVYLILSLPLAFILHDTYFYWTHRLMHHRLLFRYIHKTHHVSQHPTAFSAFAFSPIEALIQCTFVILLPMIIPMQHSLFIAFTWATLIGVIYGHNGHDRSTLKREKLGLYKVITTPHHHEMHHMRPNSNYGLWLLFWDRIMGTEHKNYYKTLKQFLQQKDEAFKKLSKSKDMLNRE